MRVQHSNQTQCHHARGFTLIEMIMSMTVLSIIGLVSSSVIMESMRIYKRTVPAIDADYRSNLALRTMKREIRELSETDAISVFTSSTFAFIDSFENSISYELTGTNLTRNGDLLASGVTSMTFRYWQMDGTVAALTSEVRLIEVDLTVQSGEQSLHVRTQIFPRNLGLPL